MNGELQPNPLIFLQGARPDWFGETASSADEIIGQASVPVPGAASDEQFGLRLFRIGSSVHVREEPRGTRLPGLCPDRHINVDGSFCLGLRFTYIVADRQSALGWWQALAIFLRNQRAAERTRRWPAQRNLSHGTEAGRFHSQAVDHAKALGIVDEYDHMVDQKSGWLFDRSVRIWAKGALVNGRALCPIDCKEAGRERRLRRKCCRRENLIGLLKSEFARRIAEEQALMELRGESLPCCGTLKRCCLRD